MLSREFGCQAAYTPMFHAAHFATQKKYRQRNFATCPKDRPLIVQFCANDPDTLLAAARHVENDCDAIDINLGCPQDIARRGRYGAFLQDEWDLIRNLIVKLRNNLDSDRLGVSCKIRRFDDISKTVVYAQMIEKAGATFIGVHGRTREQRGQFSGVANWEHIKAVKDALRIPVIANGNVQSLSDAELCLIETGADAVMTAEGNLYNPGLFSNVHPPTWDIAYRYLDYVDKYPVPAGMARSHLFKLFHRCIAMDENKDLRANFGQAHSIDGLRDVVKQFECRYKTVGDEDQTVPIRYQPVPPYLCQVSSIYNRSTLYLEKKLASDSSSQPRFRYNVQSACKEETRSDNTKTSISDDSDANCDRTNKRLKLEQPNAEVAVSES